MAATAESTGPRHLTPMLPFMALALVPLWQAAGARGRVRLLVLASVSFVLSFMCATTMMTCLLVYAGAPVRNELTDFVLPAFLQGEVHHAPAPVGNGSLGALAKLLIPVCAGVPASRVLPLIRGVATRIPIAVGASA